MIRKLLAFLSFFFGSLALAQTPAPITAMFSTGTSAMNLHLGGQNNVGSDIFAQFVVKTNAAGTLSYVARTDSLLVPGINFQGYYGGGGVKTSLDKLLASTTLPKNTFEAYGFLEGGIVRNVPATGAAVQKPSFYAHGGINYDPTASKNFTVNLLDAGYLYAPNTGFAPPSSNNGWTISVGVSLGLWRKQ